jgi:branched-chain amino acid transport system permease protein
MNEDQRPTLGRYIRRAAFLGLVAGLATLYLMLVGIIEAFQARPVISNLVGLGLIVPVIALLVVHHRAGRTPATWPEPTAGRERLVLAPIVSGLVAGLVIGAAVIAEQLLSVRDVLINLTPAVVGIIAVGTSYPVSVAAVIVLSTGLGVVAAVLHLLDPRVTKVLLTAAAAVLVMSLIEPLLRIVFLQLGLPSIATFLYRGGSQGLTQEAALLTFAVVLAAGAALVFRGRAARAKIEALPARQRTTMQVVGIAFVGVVLALMPAIVGTFLSEVVGTVGLYLLMGLGLNIVVGYAGLLDLGYVAFFAVGAYAAAILTSPVSALGWQLSLWAALPIIMLVAAFFGVAVGAPVLRLRGDYLAIVTLGFGEITRILLLSDWLRPLFGGAQGILQVPPPNLLGVQFFGPQQLYYPILISVIVGGVIAWSLANSRVGRAWNAMREDEDVAEATGINTTRYKLLAFAIGAVFGCVAGAFLAVKLGSVFPHNLNLLVSITVLSLIILGGMGSIRGVIVGALVLVGLPELLREFGEYRLLIYGVVLVAMMILRPEGLLPSATRRRELHEEEPEELQYLREAGADTGGPGISGAPA